MTGFTNPQITNVTAISDILTNTTYGIATVTYHITPHSNGCDGPLTDYNVVVYPNPDLSNPVHTASICDSTFVNIPLLSNVSNTTFTWRAFASSPNLTGYSNQTTGTTLLNQRIDNTGFTTQTVTYRILPQPTTVRETPQISWLLYSRLQTLPIPSEPTPSVTVPLLLLFSLPMLPGQPSPGGRLQAVRISQVLAIS